MLYVVLCFLRMNVLLLVGEVVERCLTFFEYYEVCYFGCFVVALLIENDSVMKRIRFVSWNASGYFNLKKCQFNQLDDYGCKQVADALLMEENSIFCYAWKNLCSKNCRYWYKFIIACNNRNEITYLKFLQKKVFIQLKILDKNQNLWNSKSPCF